MAVANGTSCSDGNICNGTESCVNGICTAGPAPQCNDNNKCSTDTCVATGGCQFTPATNGTPCSDGNVCNGLETCQSGVCSPGSPPNCDDANPCTSDYCDRVQGCRHATVANGTPCSDGNVCNGTETCIVGSCVAGNPQSCDDGNPCTIDTCDPVSGCKYTVAPDGAPCSDGNACNGLETCQSGVCNAGTTQLLGRRSVHGRHLRPDARLPARAVRRRQPAHARRLLADLGLPAQRDDRRQQAVTEGRLGGVQDEARDEGHDRAQQPADRRHGGDPVIQGGSLRLVGGGASPWSVTYTLPASNWHYFSKPGTNKGYRYIDLLGQHGPIRTAVVRDNSTSGARGQLPKVAMSLSQNPEPVGVVITLGSTRYCMSFGGTGTFLPGIRFGAKDASAPATCPP